MLASHAANMVLLLSVSCYQNIVSLCVHSCMGEEGRQYLLLRDYTVRSLITSTLRLWALSFIHRVPILLGTLLSQMNTVVKTIPLLCIYAIAYWLWLWL